MLLCVVPNQHHPHTDSQRGLNTEKGSEAVAWFFCINLSWSMYTMLHCSMAVSLCIYIRAPT